MGESGCKGQGQCLNLCFDSEFTTSACSLEAKANKKGKRDPPRRGWPGNSWHLSHKACACVLDTHLDRQDRAQGRCSARGNLQAQRHVARQNGMPLHQDTKHTASVKQGCCNQAVHASSCAPHTQTKDIGKASAFEFGGGGRARAGPSWALDHPRRYRFEKIEGLRARGPYAAATLQSSRTTAVQACFV